MEYDNDRPVQPVYKPEIVYWIAVCLFYPLINFVSFFHSEIGFLSLLLLVSILLFLFYFLYARVIVPNFGFRKKYIWFSIICVALYIVVFLLLMLIYSYVHLDADTSPFFRSMQAYFTFTPSTILRESL